MVIFFRTIPYNKYVYTRIILGLNNINSYLILIGIDYIVLCWKKYGTPSIANNI